MTSNSRVLVTGVNGFVGHHLVEELVGCGHEVVGVALEDEPYAGLPLVDYHSVDLTQAWPDIAPVDGIVHLAGLSAVGPSFDRPQLYLDVNGSMINHLAAWMGRTSPQARALVVSSGAVYDSMHDGPLDENAPVALTSPYVVSKLLVENLVGYYRRRGLDVVVARPFNHIGPGQGPGFLVPDLHAAMAADTSGTLRVGDLSTARDYTDVRDVVSAYRMLLEAPALQHATYNVCSGAAVAGTSILELLRTCLHVGDLEVTVDAGRIRPDDPREITGDASRLRDELGWSPMRSVSQSVGDFVTTARS